MPGSGAGLNKVGPFGGVTLLQASTDGTWDSGIKMTEASGYSKWLFQLVAPGSISGWSVTVYGTIDPGAFLSTRSPAAPGFGSGYTFPTSSWFALPAPSTEDTAPDAFAWANPLTALGQALYSSAPLVAVRVVAIGSSSSGSIGVLGFAIP